MWKQRNAKSVAEEREQIIVRMLPFLCLVCCVFVFTARISEIRVLFANVLSK
jgi:hypothetical protein